MLVSNGKIVAPGMCFVSKIAFTFPLISEGSSNLYDTAADGEAAAASGADGEPDESV
jgi:hypothetical protein